MDKLAEQPRIPFRLLAVFLLALAVIAGSGIWIYRLQDSYLRHDAENDLNSLVTPKITAIHSWRQELLNTAMLISKNRSLHRAAPDFAARPSDERRDNFIIRLQPFQDAGHYEDILLADKTGKVFFSLSGKLRPLTALEQDGLQQALQTGRPVVTDLFLQPTSSAARLSLIAPLIGTDTGKPAAEFGAVLVVDPYRQLYPILRTWPTDNTTAEAQLVRREGDHVLFLNGLRYQPNTTLKLAIPLTKTNVLAVMAVTRPPGFAEGRDYRGVRVIAAFGPVPDSPWFVIGKIDWHEAFALWRERVALILITAIFLLFAVAVVLAVVWQRKMKMHYIQAYRAELESQALREHFAYLIKHANDIITLTDDDERIVEVNDRALEAYGYTRGEIIGHPVQIIIPMEGLHGFKARRRCLQAEGSFRGETIHQRKDGTQFPVEISMRQITVEGRMFIQTITRDITERRQAEAALRESEEKYRKLFSEMSTGWALHELICDKSGTPVDYVTLEVNTAFERLLAVKRADVVGRRASEILPAAELSKWLGVFGPVALTGKSASFENYSNLTQRCFEGTAYCLEGCKFAETFIDVTERKLAEKALREREEQFRVVFDTGPDAIFLIGSDGRFMLANRMAVERYGYTADEFKTMTPAELAATELSQDAMAKMHRALQEPGQFEWRHRRKDGRELPVEIHTCPTELDGRRCIIAVVHDITERQHISDRLQLTAAVLNVLNRSADTRTMIRDTLKLIKDATGFDAVGLRLRQGDDYPYYEQSGFLDGFLVEENFLCARGNDGAILRDADGHPVLECMCGMVLAGRTDPGMPNFSANGSWWTDRTSDLLAIPPEADRRINPRNRCVHVGYQTVALIPVRTGREIIGLMQFNDRRVDFLYPGQIRFFESLATSMGMALERKQAEEALRHSREEWENIFQAIGQPAVVMDVQHRIILANQAMMKASGKTLEELRGLKCYQIFHGSDTTGPATACPMERAMRSGNQELQEVESELLHGSFLMSCTPVRNAAGQVEKVIHVATDVTEIKRLQQDLQQAQKMESVGRLAGGVAHDFNNILQTILGYSDLLLNSIPPGDERHGDVQEIHRSGERAAALTRQLLAFSRRQMLMPQVASLNDIVVNFVKMLTRLIGENVTLKLDLAPDLRHVKVDTGQIEQVLMNLAVNARDAMPDGGQLAIRTANIALDDEDAVQDVEGRAGRFVSLSLTDNGAGMSKEVQTRIFEPFYTTKGRGQGTGLGLSTVYGIVKQHEGRVTVYSEPGQGSTFTIYLPAVGSAESQADSLIEALPAAPAGAGQCVLAVEDDILVRKLMVNMLKTAGYRVVAAATVDDARAAFAEHAGEIELVVSDVILPDGNGIDLARELLGQKAELRYVLTSGYADIHTRWPEIVQHGWRFLIKPFSRNDLLNAVYDVLRQG